MMNNKVFVYGTLRQGNGNHQLLETANLVGTGKTCGEHYTMISLGGFPAVYLTGDVPIIGELYDQVDERTMNRLDMLEGYPSFYNRTEVEVIIDGEPDTAWMYYFEGDARHARYGDSVIATGNWEDR